MLRRFVIGICALAGIGAGLWYAPEINPIDHFLFERAHPLSWAQLDDPGLLANARPVDANILYQQKALLIPQGIPLSECRVMVQVLKEQKERTDEFLFKNTRGGFNCPFADLGLRHFEYPPAVSGENTSADEKFFRSSFVGRPSYSLFRSRLSIVYGHRTSGVKCTYNRLTGHWKREVCHLAYAIDPI